MFRHRPQVIFATPLENKTLEPVHGFMFSAEQGSLKFGADRKDKIFSRPVLSVRKRDDFVVALPLTSKENNSPAFYQIPSDEVQWNHSENRQSFAHREHETVGVANLHNKIGVIAQNTRMNIAKWLNGFYGDEQ
ncbi:MAG: hypothetical protein WBI40_10030 [Methylococcaceae bacterium]